MKFFPIIMLMEIMLAYTPVVVASYLWTKGDTCGVVLFSGISIVSWILIMGYKILDHIDYWGRKNSGTN
jgi:hypothetical protein